MPRNLAFDFAIIGGGAAGFFAAITAAEQAGLQKQSIVILEKANQPLGKVLISGGGRCNVTYACFDPALLVTYYPRGATALRGAFSRFQPSDTIAWFESHGVSLKTEADGRVFPRSNSSRSITGCLLGTAQSAGVEIKLNTAVESIEVNQESTERPRFHIKIRPTGRMGQHTELPVDIFAHRVLLATGGDRISLSLAASLGHSIEPPVPSLFSFQIVDPRLEGLAGLSVDPVSLTLEEQISDPNQRTGLSSQEGPVLVTHWGLSGPAVLKLSAWGARWLNTRRYQAGLRVNWLHPLNFDQVYNRLVEFKNEPSWRTHKIAAQHVFPEIPIRLWQRIIASAGIPETVNWANVSREYLRHIATELTRCHFSIKGKGPFKEEFVTCGGVKLEEVNFKTMESRLLSGLYFAGELLDVDGLTGGFNFQNAWTTGWLAGNAMSAGNPKIPS